MKNDQTEVGMSSDNNKEQSFITNVHNKKIHPGKTGSERSAKAVEALIEMAAEDQARMGEKLDDSTKKAFQTDIRNTAGLELLKKHLLR